MSHCGMRSDLSGLLEVSVDHVMMVGINVGPEAESCGIEREVVSLSVTVTEKCTKPAEELYTEWCVVCYYVSILLEY